jgi:hypothetical protein
MAPKAARRHHYIPQFHQNGFADIDQRLWLYDRRTQKYAKAHPANICCENDLYMIDPTGRRNSYIETNWLSKVDRDGAAAIRQVEAGLTLDQDWSESFSVFMAPANHPHASFPGLDHQELSSDASRIFEDWLS